MSFLPKIKRCPFCSSLHVIKTNGAIYKNTFQSLNKWSLKKIFNCRKCNIELGLFSNNSEFNEKEIQKLIWMELLNCEDRYHTQLKELNGEKDKYRTTSKRFFETNNTIRQIQNKIRSDQIKVKIKVRMRTRLRGILAGDAY